MTEIDSLELIAHIRHRLKKLEAKIMDERVQMGECPHRNLQKITDITQLKEGYEVYHCKDCHKFFRKKLSD